MSKFKITGGNQGAVGDKSRAKNVNQKYSNKSLLTNDQLSDLVAELPKVLLALNKSAKTKEQLESVDYVRAAQEAAQGKNAQGVLTSLKSAGAWVIEVARSVGAEVVAKLIENQMGMG